MIMIEGSEGAQLPLVCKTEDASRRDRDPFIHIFIHSIHRLIGKYMLHAGDAKMERQSRRPLGD